MEEDLDLMRKLTISYHEETATHRLKTYQYSQKMFIHIRKGKLEDITSKSYSSGTKAEDK